MKSFFLKKLTDYWDTNQTAIPQFSQALGKLDDPERKDTLHVIEQAIAKHCSVLSDRWLLQAALCMVEDIYRQGNDVQQADSANTDYLRASAGTFTSILKEKGLVVRYLIDNVFATDSPHWSVRPFVLLREWFEAAGFVYICPQLIANMLIGANETSLPPTKNISLSNIEEAREVAGDLVQTCEEKNRHYVKLELDPHQSLLDSSQLSAPVTGILTIYRSEGPGKGSTCQAIFPEGLEPA